MYFLRKTDRLIQTHTHTGTSTQTHTHMHVYTHTCRIITWPWSLSDQLHDLLPHPCLLSPDLLHFLSLWGFSLLILRGSHTRSGCPTGRSTVPSTSPPGAEHVCSFTFICLITHLRSRLLLEGETISYTPSATTVLGTRQCLIGCWLNEHSALHLAF